jgi:DNA-binding XRE family transcriptional regulator/predicted RNase H-like HicB family nuclease
MHYVAYISKEGRHTLAEFPDCPGCQTFSDGEDLAALAREALEGWLEAHLVDGQVPPRPVERTGAPQGVSVARVPVRPGLAAALEIRWARRDAGLSQGVLGRLAGVSQQQIAKLENPDENPSLETLEKVARALGLMVNVGFERPDTISPVGTRKSSGRGR